VTAAIDIEIAQLIEAIGLDIATLYAMKLKKDNKDIVQNISILIMKYTQVSMAAKKVLQRRESQELENVIDVVGKWILES